MVVGMLRRGGVEGGSRGQPEDFGTFVKPDTHPIHIPGQIPIIDYMKLVWYLIILHFPALSDKKKKKKK